MGKLFRIDGGLMVFLSKVSDVCIISALWLICCIPVFTIGASTTAAYYTIIKVVRRQTGTIFKEFFGCFRRNWRDSFVINLIYLLLMGVLAFNIYTMYHSLETISFAFELLFFYFMLFLLMIALGVYTYPVLSRFEMKKGKLVRFSVFAMFRHFPTTILLLVLFIGSFALIILLPVGVIIMPGVCLHFYSVFMERILRKYMSEEMLTQWDSTGEMFNDEEN